MPRTRTVYHLRITLQDIQPPIWRRIQVWEDVTLAQLHTTLQIVMDWEDYHLHEFSIGKRIYSVPDPEDDLYERTVIDPRGSPQIRPYRVTSKPAIQNWPGQASLYLADDAAGKDRGSRHKLMFTPEEDTATQGCDRSAYRDASMSRGGSTAPACAHMQAPKAVNPRGLGTASPC